MKDSQALLSLLRKNQMRLTKPRLEFVKLLSTALKPLSVSDILFALEDRGVKVNKTTVYREIERFQKLGILRVVDLGERKQYFESADLEHHHHFVCLNCEKVEDIELDERELLQQEASLARRKGLSVYRHSLEFFGLCKVCH